jgi:hypothetical protein
MLTPPLTSLALPANGRHIGATKFDPSMVSPIIFSARRDIYNCGMPDIGCANA